MSHSVKTDKELKFRDEEEYTRIMNGLTKCPFCDLKEKYVIAEDSGLVLTMNLYPYIDYHMMIIPRRHVINLREMNNQEMIAFRNLQYAAAKLLHKKGIKNTHTIYREGPDSDRSLGHMHIHIIPYREKVITKHPLPLKYDVKETAKNLQKHKSYLKEKLLKIKKNHFDENSL